MKTKLYFLFIGLALIAGIHKSAAQTAQFFRIVGPTAVAITKLGADGSLVWTGATPGLTYTVQTATTPVGGNWVDSYQFVAGGRINTNFTSPIGSPAGMVLIPAGAFTIGDTLDGLNDAIPANVTVSAFYMDANLVSSNQWAGVYNYGRGMGYTFTNTVSQPMRLRRRRPTIRCRW